MYPSHIPFSFLFSLHPSLPHILLNPSLNATLSIPYAEYWMLYLLKKATMHCGIGFFDTYRHGTGKLPYVFPCQFGQRKSYITSHTESDVRNKFQGMFMWVHFPNSAKSIVSKL